VTGWALALVLAAGPRVAVDVLAKDAPAAAAVSGAGRALSLAARGDVLLVDGRPAPPLSLPAGRWRVEPSGSAPRGYRAALAVRAEAGILRFRADMALEDYVAAVVASETLPGTPAAALEAQAIVVRSYALASRDRHPGGALCDLAHCQVLRAHGLPRRHADAAAAAARATRGEVLRLPGGGIAAAPFHAACGGHTADPVEAFGSAASGAVAAADPGCERHPWAAVVPAEGLARALAPALARSGGAAASERGAALDASTLTVVHGRGGWSSQVAGGAGGWRLSGDAFARAADASVGRGRVRSSRFTLASREGSVVVRGAGRGHGVGLCQEGAARHAAEGEDRYRILSRYFAARVAPMARSIESPVQK
jgi:stage II sporulation protein D (peptidoglycan lytic transglycosylase)